MDVLCTGMYRACSTWQYEVAAHLIERYKGGQRLGYITGDAYAALRANEPNPGGWRVLKSHEGHPAFRRALRAGEAISIYAIRDVRDVVYSMLHKRQVDFETFLRQGMIHQILANDHEWTRRAKGRRLDQRYEQITADPTTAVRDLARFLNLHLSATEAHELALEYSFEANQKRTQRTADSLRAAGLDLDDPTNAIVHDQKTLLHWNHMRQGRVGDWRDRAIPSERYVLALLTNRWLDRHVYDPESLDASREAIDPRQRRHLNRLAARGWAACRLRCLALDFPRLGRAAKRLLGLQERDIARPASAVPRPHVGQAASAQARQEA